MENGGKPRSNSRLARILRILSRLAWLLRILYIIFSLEVGISLIALPSLPFWGDNYLTYRFPSLRPLVVNPFLKGAVLGLGIVNVLIGFYEIVRFRKGSGGYFSR